MLKSLDQNKKYLLIVPNELKNKTLDKVMSFNKLMPIKIMTINEIKNRLFFEPTSKTFTSIYSKFNKPLSIVNTLIDYLYYIDINKEYKSEKINELKEIKKYLFTNNLVKLDSRFISILKQYNVIFYDFVIIDKEVTFIINEIKKYCNVDIYSNYSKIATPSLIHTKTLEEEINYVAYEISNLLNKEDPIDINNIKICNVNDEYNIYLKRIFKNYNIPLNLKEKVSLFSLPISNEFINLLKENSKEDVISILKDKYPDYIEYINMYINILNKYNYLSNIDINLLTYELKNTYIKNINISNAVEVINLNEVGNSDYYIFVMSCNYDYFPKIIKDEDYLLDIEKEELDISTSKDINKNNVNTILKLIYSSKNIYLSYKLNSYFNEFHKVDFLNDLLDQEYTKEIKVSYSKNEDIITLTKLYDSNKTSNDFFILKNTITIPYNEYDHSFKPIDESFYSNLVPSISYSSLNTFFECPFKYYVSKILKLDEFEGSVYTAIGNIMHSVIEHSFDDDFDFEKQFELSKEFYTKDLTFTHSEKFFIDNIKERTLQVVNFLKDKENLTKLTKKEHERDINFYKVINGHKVYINGKIDKIIYNTINDTLYTALIDIKTGKDKIDPNLFEYGLNLQLPFYTYLLKNEPNEDNEGNYKSDNNENKKTYFNNTKILGLYIHNVLNNENNDKTLKYNGYSLNDQFLLPILDSSCNNSMLISSLSITTKNEFNKNSKLFTSEEIENLPLLIEEKIKEMVNGIFSGDFKIAPKKIGKDDMSCEYCKYFAICYKTNKNYTYIKKPEKKGDK